MICLLCLKDVEEAGGIITFNSNEAELLSIMSVIEKHIHWLQTNDARCICLQCWECLYSFHQFYLSVERAHNMLLDNSMKENNDDGLINSVVDALDVNTQQSAGIKKEFCSSVIIKKRGRPPRLASTTLQDECINKDEIKSEILEDCNSMNDLEFNMDCDVPDIEYDDDDCRKELPKVKEKALVSVIATRQSTRIKQERSKLKIKTNVASKTTRKILPKRKKDAPHEEDQLQNDSSATKLQFQSNQSKMKVSEGYDTFIAANFKLNCSLCNEDIDNFTALLKHFREHHQIRGYAMCCGRKFLKRGLLVDHLYVHQNPEYFKCNICQRVMTTRHALDLHKVVHTSNKERIYQCDECPKSFFKYFVYMRHTYIHTPESERHVSCPQCSKKFSTEYIMKQHLNHVHLETYKKMCEICGKSLRTRDQLQRHMELHAGMPKQNIKCDICGIMLTTKVGLRRHIKLMHTEENRQPIACPFCQKLSPSLEAQKRHIQFTHQMQRKHQCQFCDKAFKRARELIEHIATHTGEVLYTCPHCPKTFNSNANLHSHRKKVHRQEWEERRLQRYQPQTKALNQDNIQPPILNDYRSDNILDKLINN